MLKASKTALKKFIVPSLITFLVLLADQSLKIWVKLNMYLGQEYFIFGDWFRLHFTENPGMAFGMTLGGEYGKIILSLFRIFAVLFIAGYMRVLMKNKSAPGLIVSLSFILAGALGNIIDSVLYGLVFSDSINKLATFMPEAGGYATLFHGKVVDMLYFPVFQGFIPSWIPIWGDSFQIFFRPVFNIADAAITVGVAMIMVFQKRYFKEEENPDEPIEADRDTNEPATSEAASERAS